MKVGDKVVVLSGWYEGYGGIRRGEEGFVVRIADFGMHPVWIKDAFGRECCFAIDELSVVDGPAKPLPDPRDYNYDASDLRIVADWQQEQGNRDLARWMRATAAVLDEEEAA